MNPVLRKDIRTKARNARREFDARSGCSSVGALPKGKTYQRLVVKSLWIYGKTREEWMEDVKAHSESCYDDKGETSKMQEERIQAQP